MEPKKRTITFDPVTTPGLPPNEGEPGFDADQGEEARAALSRIESIVAGEGTFDPQAQPLALSDLGRTMTRTEREYMEAAQEEEEEIKKAEEE